MVRVIAKSVNAIWRRLLSPLLVGAPFVVILLACAAGVTWMADWMAEDRIVGLALAGAFFLFLCWLMGSIIKYAHARAEAARAPEPQFRAFEVGGQEDE